MSFSDILDQDAAVEMLRQAIESGRTGHAYVFVGPDGVGKELVARTFAKALNCLQIEDDACETCSSCNRISHETHPDFHVVRPAGASRTLSVETTRSVVSEIMLKPYEARKKIYLVIEADRMNDAAANSLLKTLEEPPPNSVLILITSNPSGLLWTIRSRCHEIRFGALKEGTVRRLLVNQGVPEDRAEVAARLSEGQMDRALDLVDSNRRETVLEFVRRLEDEDPVALAIEFGEQLEIRCKEAEAELGEVLDSEGTETEAEKAAARKGARRREICENLGLFLIWYRDLLIMSVLGRQAPLLNTDRLDALEKQAAMSSPEQVRKCIDAIDEARIYVDRNIKMERNLINLFLVLTGGSRQAARG